MEYKLPPLPEREAFETWMQGDATISLEKDGHGYVDMTAELMWYAWKARAAIEAQASVVQQEPFGCVTVVRKLGHSDTFNFYRHPQPPYLDNASECHTVYTHPAQQAKLQPMTVEQIWENDALMALNAEAGLSMTMLEKIVGIVEAAHGIQGS